MGTKKMKPIKAKRISRTVKQHTSFVSDREELMRIASRYRNVKNYVYSRYSGVNSLLLLNKHRQTIRDVWMRSDFAQQWKLPARYWKLAVDEAVSNIKSKWANTKNAIRTALRANENVTEEERHFIYYVLKADGLLHAILTRTDYELPEALKLLEIRSTYIHNLIRRYVRKYKKGIPYSKSANSFSIDRPMYKYYTQEGTNCIEITSTVPKQRIHFRLKDLNRYGGTVQVVIKDDKVAFHHHAETKVRKLTEEERAVGADKGHRTLLATSSGNLYGEKLNDLLNRETERLNSVNAKRNRIYAQIKKCEETGDIEKANRIRENNFGKKKYNRQKAKFDATTKSTINLALNQFFKTEKPSDVIQEDLSFVSWNKKFPKKTKRQLSRWIKGYVRERIEFKCEVWGVRHHKVNAAYTSQVCYLCKKFGKRNGDIFTCEKCGGTHADINASRNVLDRWKDKEITLYTNYKTVKKILEARAATVAT